MDYWQDRVQQNELHELNRALGIIWTKEDVVSSAEEKRRRRGKTPTEIRLPLTYVIEPGVIDIVKKYFSQSVGIDAPKWAYEEDLVDLYDTGKDEFLKFVRSFVAPKVS